MDELESKRKYYETAMRDCRLFGIPETIEAFVEHAKLAQRESGTNTPEWYFPALTQYLSEGKALSLAQEQENETSEADTDGVGA